MYGNILVPTDGSETAEAALEHAIDLATAYDAALHVLYVVDTRALGQEAAGGAVLDHLEREGERAIERAVDRAEAADVRTVEGSVADGSPHRAILGYVDERDVDLVVMGTHGRTGLDRYLLGSVTEKVVRTCPVPVLTVRSPEAE